MSKLKRWPGGLEEAAEGAIPPGMPAAMSAEEMAAEGIFKVDAIVGHRFSRRFEFETSWDGYAETTWEPIGSFIMGFKTRPGGYIEETFDRYIRDHHLVEVIRAAEARVRRLEGGGVAEPAQPAVPAEASTSSAVARRGFTFA